MEKLVVKTAVKTVLIILGVFIAVFAVINFAFPQHMATLTEGIGNYDLAVKYANLRYSYTKNCDDLARCFDDSVLWGEDKYILEYGEKLIAHKDYESICEKRNEEQTGKLYNYDRWVKSKLCVSMYNTGKKGKAIELASVENGTDSFIYGNAFMALSTRIKANKDAESAAIILAELEKINPSDATEQENLTHLKEIMRGVK